MSESTTFVTVMNVINTVTQLLLGAVALSAIFAANTYAIPVHLPQHIYLCVTGYVILMSQAILSLTPYSGWTKSLSFEQRKMVHWILQIGGSTLAIAGTSVRISGISSSVILSNFSTPHGIFGLIAMICTIFSLIGGIVNLFSSQLSISPKLIKICHSIFGTLTICCAFISLCLGFNNIYRTSFGNINANMSIVFTVFALVGTIMSSSYNLFRRIANN